MVGNVTSFFSGPTGVEVGFCFFALANGFSFGGGKTLIKISLFNDN